MPTYWSIIVFFLPVFCNSGIPKLYFVSGSLCDSLLLGTGIVVPFIDLNMLDID